MDSTKNKKVINNITAEINKLKDKKFNFYFFVFDTKGTPNGELAYIYETATVLKNEGYNVKMLHGEADFVGAKEWLGERYTDFEHLNIETDGVTISPADFLVIPEIYSNVMYKTFEKKLPCKRIALLRNSNYLTEIITPGSTWMDYGIHDCVTATDILARNITEYFPTVKAKTVKPCVADEFANNTEAKKLIINVVSREKTDLNKIVKTFFWKHPMYKWIGFRELRGLSREDFAKALDEAFCTIWVDTDTDFGCTALEAMASGNLVVGKIPDTMPEWITDENENLIDNGIWFYDINRIPEIIAGVVQSFLKGTVPSVVYDMAEVTVKKYSTETFKKNVLEVYVEGYVNERIKDMEEALTVAKKNNQE